jgi:hypothetical protein
MRTRFFLPLATAAALLLGHAAASASDLATDLARIR